MHLHKINDALNRKGNYALMAHKDVDQPGIVIAKAMAKDAVAFDFGALMFERTPGSEAAYEVPNLTEEEWEFFREGLIPLPYKVCWFEFSLGGHRNGFLVRDDGDYWFMSRWQLERDEAHYDGVWMSVFRRMHNGVGAELELRGNEEYVKSIEADGIKAADFYGAASQLLVYLALMLNSKSTETEHVEAPTKLNKKRVGKGLTPLPAHRIVKIVPDRYRVTSDGKGGTHRSPRLHWRRSHVRTYGNGKRIVIARMLVGKAELGEISHEYKIGE